MTENDPGQDFRFSYSAVDKWLTCRQKWHYSYRRRLEPIIADARPQIGSAVHYALAMAILCGGDDQQLAEYLVLWGNEQLERYEGLPDDVFEVIRAEMVTIVQTARIVAIRAVAALPLEDWETVFIDGEPAVEWEFERPIPGLGTFVGQVDWIARHRSSGLVWLFDHKIRTRLAPAMTEDFNIQMAVYQDILQQDYGLRMAGSITFQVSSQLPKTPKLNKDGSMSRSAIATDWPTYRDALLAAGIHPASYVDMQEKLSNRDFFDQTRYYRPQETTRAIWEQIFLPAAREMRAAMILPDIEGMSHPRVIRSMSTRTCRGCEFSEVCLAELCGRDAEYLIRIHYRHRPDHAERRYELPEPQEV